MKIAFIVDPLDDFKIYKDSTFAMMREAAVRKHDLYVLQQEDVVWQDGKVTGHAQRLHLTGDTEAWYRADPAQATALEDFDAVLMRKDPPFDMSMSTARICSNSRRGRARAFSTTRVQSATAMRK